MKKKVEITLEISGKTLEQDDTPNEFLIDELEETIQKFFVEKKFWQATDWNSGETADGTRVAECSYSEEKPKYGK